MTSKFAKYVPEEDKKKQREHIGAMGLSDMPFGEMTGEIIIVESFTSEYGSETPKRNQFELALEEGETYIVNWDAEVYECICFIDDWDRLVVGNASLMETGDNTNEPFLIGVQDGDSFVKAQIAGEHTLTMSYIGTTIKTLDPKYLPGCPVWYFDENSTYGSIYADADKTIEIPYSAVRDTILSVSPWLKNLDTEYPAFVKLISVDIRDSSVYITYYDGDYKYFTVYDPYAMDS